MKIRTPVLAGAIILIMVLISVLILWFVHGNLLRTNGGPKAEVRLTDLRQGTRFPRSPHHFYSTHPTPGPTPTQPELRWTDEAGGRVHLPHDLAGELILLKGDNHEGLKNSVDAELTDPERAHPAR